MNPYTFALFLHLLGVIGFFMPLGVYLFGVLALRRAKGVQQVRSTCQMIFATDAVAVSGVLLVAIAGLYLAITTWGLTTGWVIVAIVSFALMAPVGPLVVERRLHALAKLAAATPDGPLPHEIRRRITDPLMSTALCMMIVWLLGIIYLMATKPPLMGAILAMGIALLLGVIMGIPFWFTRRPIARA